MAGKHAGNSCRPGKGRPATCRVRREKPLRNSTPARWHGPRIMNGTSALNGEHRVTRTLQAAFLAALTFVMTSVPAGSYVAHQGPREYRGRAPESIDRLRPGRRSQRHRRYPQQYSFHQAVAAGDAGTPWRQCPRPAAAHRQRRRGDGDRQPAGFGTQGTRMDVTVSALGDSKSLQGGTLLVTPLLGADGNVYSVGAGLGRHRRLPGGRRSLQDHPRRADRRPHRQWRHHRTRDRFRAQPAVAGAAGLAQCRLHHRQAHRRGGQRFHRHRHRRAAGSFHRRADRTAAVPRQRGVAAHRDRAIADRARPGRQDRDRRTLRHHRHGPRRARLDGGGGAGQSHGDDLGDAAGQPAQSLLAAAAPPRSCRAPGSACRKTARSSLW